MWTERSIAAVSSTFGSTKPKCSSLATTIRIYSRVDRKLTLKGPHGCQDGENPLDQAQLLIALLDDLVDDFGPNW
jgi:hypothetical protein